MSHFPVNLLCIIVLGVNNDEGGSGYINSKEDDDSPSMIGMSLHSSSNCEVFHQLTFNGLPGNSKSLIIPSSD